MFDADFVKWLATLGVGGVLAGFMFSFYRKDVRQYTELWKLATDQLMLVVKENSASNARLIVMLEAAERNALRKSDLDMMFQQAQLNAARSAVGGRSTDRVTQP